MSFDELKEEQTFVAIAEKKDAEFINLGEIIASGGYAGVKHHADDFKKKHPGRWVRVAMVVEEVGA